MMSTLKDSGATARDNSMAENSLQSLDSLINRIQGYKRKVEDLHEHEKTLHGHSSKRIAHLQDLYNIKSLVDPAYGHWSRRRLDILLVDLLLRSGYGRTAQRLAAEKDIQVRIHKNRANLTLKCLAAAC